MKKIKVYVRFYDVIAKNKKKKEIEVGISSDPEKGINEIKELVVSKIGRGVLYTLLINKINYSMLDKKNYTLNNGDIFTIVPVIVGG